MATARKPGKSDTAYEGFTPEERAAMKDRVRELKATTRRGSGAAEADGESEVLGKIAELTDTDRAIAERVHAVIRASAPGLTPRLWYGMPAYAQAGSIVCHFQPAQKFKTRYPTLGFSDKANLDDGAMWPTSFALMKLTAAVEARIAELVQRAVS